MGQPRRVRVIDSHTEGEPTRVVIEGGPSLTSLSLADRVAELREEHDGFRSGVVCEPRGSDAVVGALLCEPSDPGADFGVIFFNNVGYLGMCGHGAIGLVRTLQHLGRVQPGPVAIETPVGLVHATLREDGRVSVRNVPSYRYRTGVAVEVPGYGEVVGDIAWGGNWFFLVAEARHALCMENLEPLTRFAAAVREALEANGIAGENGALIDHVELFGPPSDPGNHSRNFVLCPGLAYDRSPCGTGTSAKLACLRADGKLAPGETWRQESVIGSLFEGRYEEGPDGSVLPEIGGRAYIVAESTLLFDPEDPFVRGIAP